MALTTRKERDREQMRLRILEAANEIVGSEGFDKLSIRRIASRIEYSPTILYSYFKDKNAIVSALIEQHSKIIFEALSPFDEPSKTPANALAESLEAYIRLILTMKESFKTIVMSDLSTQGCENTNVKLLHQGATDDNPAMTLLRRILERGMRSGDFAKGDSTMLAQLIWLSTYGLLSRLIIEEPLPPDQMGALIEGHLRFVLSALRK